MRHSLVLAGRAVTKIRRTPEQFLDVTLQPILFVVLFVYLFGGAVAGSTHDYLQYVLPGLLVQTVLFSTISVGVNLHTDIRRACSTGSAPCRWPGPRRWSEQCWPRWCATPRPSWC